MTKIRSNFYLREDVVEISRDLLGKYLCSKIQGVLTTGIITETEAYAGVEDRASHAFGNKRTKRTEVMYAKGGVAYVYLCYGIHHLFNIVTNRENVPHAVLIRAIQPVDGLEMMAKRRNTKNKLITNGPGTISQALGIRTQHSGIDLQGDEIWLEDNGIHIPDRVVIIGPRVGVEYAKEDARLPYRFRIVKPLKRM